MRGDSEVMAGESIAERGGEEGGTNCGSGWRRGGEGVCEREGEDGGGGKEEEDF